MSKLHTTTYFMPLPTLDLLITVWEEFLTITKNISSQNLYLTRGKTFPLKEVRRTALLEKLSSFAKQ